MSISELTRYLLYISTVLWLFPPIRQYKRSLFYFFLVLALLDPISFIYLELTNKNLPFGFYITANFLLFISILEKESIRRNLFFIILSGLILLGIIVFAGFTSKQSLIILLAFQFLILSVILKKFIINFALNKRINFFQLVLIFYVLTIITKFLNLLTNFADATAFFIITSIAQIIFGFYFSIVRENNS